MKKNTLIVILMLFSFTWLSAQVASYSFSSSSGTYVPLDPLTATAEDGAEADSYISGAIPIGFSFVFEGTPYTDVKASSNGFLSFNLAGTNNQTTNNLDFVAATSRPLVAPLWDDHDGRATTAVSAASYITEGTAPNRVFTFEWLNWEWRYDSDDPVISFQAKLYETTNVIEFVYQQETGAVVSASASIGISGVGSGTGSFLSLDGTGATPNASSTSETFNINTKPATGQIYTFSPPTCPMPGGLTANVVGVTSAELAWTSGGAAHANIEYGPAGFTQGTGTVVVVSTNPYTLMGLNPATDYEWYVQDSCGVADLSNYSTSSAFTTQCNVFTAPFTENFDAATSLPNCWTMSGSESWVFAPTGGHVGDVGVFGSSTSGGNLAYVDDSSPDNTGTTITSPLIDISSLTTPALIFDLLSNNEGFSNVTLNVDVFDGAAWNNGMFTNTGNTAAGDWEQIILNLATLTVTGPIQVRFVVDELVTGDFYDDIAIDDVTVVNGPTCYVPSMLNVSAVTSITADLAWATGGAANWIIEYGPSGFTQGTGTMIPTAVNPTQIAGLMPQTSYDFYVRDSCGLADLSDWSAVASFFTDCTGPLSGVYTIGSNVTDDYASFADALVALNNCGVSAPVTINVEPGTYTESADLGIIMGTSMTNTVTFDGGAAASTILTSTGGANNATISLDGSQHVSFLNMTIENTDTGADVWGVYLTNGAEHITIDNCIITMEQSTSSDRAGVISSNSSISASSYGNNANFITVSNSTILNAYYGVIFNGGTISTVDTDFNNGNVIENNIIDAYLYGVYLRRQDSVMVSGNTIYTSDSNTGMDAIYAFDIMNFDMSANTINVPDWGLYISDGNADGTPVGRSLISNNMIQSETDYGIYLIDVSETDIYHNNSLADRPYARTGTSAGLAVQNNIFVSNNNDFAFADFNTSPASIYTIFDHNIFDTEGTNLFDFGANYSDLAAFQADALNAGLNVNSLEGDPLFVSTTDLHVLGILADGVAFVIPSITEDIDGEARTAMPDIGADEFMPATCFAPTTFNIDVLGSDSVVISWVAGGSETLWDIEYGVSGFVQGTGTLDLGVSNPATLTNLAVLEDYDYYVRSSCSVTDSSLWDGPYSFTTLNADDAGVVGNAETLSCGMMDSYVQVEVENFGINDLYNVAVTVNLTGVITNSFTATIDTLFAQSIQNVIVDSINTVAGGIIDFEAYTTFALDNDISNDTFLYTMEYAVLPIAPVFPTQMVCENEQVELNTSLATLWYEAGTNNVILDDSLMSFTATQDTVFDYAIYTSSSFQVGNTVAPISSFITTTAGWGIIFNTSEDIFINTAVVYPTGTGTIDVDVIDNITGTIITSATGIAVTDGGTPLSANVITLGLNIPASTDDYRLVLTNYTGITNLGRGSSQPGPYTSSNGVTVLGGSTGNAAISTAYYWFYDWNVVIPGCDSERQTVAITVQAATSSTIDTAICAGETFMFDGLSLTTAGTYIDTLIGMNTCDSIVTLNLSVNPILTSTIDSTICDGDNVMFGGMMRTISGTYVDTLSGVTSCDSIVTLNLTVNMPSASSQDSTICAGDNVMFGGTMITMAGTYMDTLLNATGCDSIITLTLMVDTVTLATQDTTICSNESVVFGGANISTAGTYVETLLNANGCDSLITTLTLMVNMTSTSTIDTTICDGEIYTFAGQDYTVSGMYTSTTTNALGCDSITTLNLTVNPTNFIAANLVLCQGFDLTLPGGTVVTTVGTYEESFMNALGCDSTISYTVTEGIPTASTIEIELCDTTTYTLPSGVVVTDAGVFTELVANATGCSDTVTYNITKCVGIFDLENNISIVAFPNPTRNKLTVQFEERLSSENAISITNLLGQVVYTKVNFENLSLDINTSELTNGVYYINVRSENKTSAIPFTVAK